jgi:hypothetical protein
MRMFSLDSTAPNTSSGHLQVPAIASARWRLVGERAFHRSPLSCLPRKHTHPCRAATSANLRQMPNSVRPGFIELPANLSLAPSSPAIKPTVRRSATGDVIESRAPSLEVPQQSRERHRDSGGGERRTTPPLRPEVPGPWLHWQLLDPCRLRAGRVADLAGQTPPTPDQQLSETDEHSAWRLPTIASPV